MARGGARNRSGPQADPQSGRSDRRGFSLSALPSEGFAGEIPAFPLPATDSEIGSREAEIWVEIWRTPQAAAWARESWRWSVLGEYCRLKATVEAEPGANAALVTQLHRYRDQIGLTPAGLRENGWAIATDELEPKRAEKESESVAARTAPVRRLRVANGDG